MLEIPQEPYESTFTCISTDEKLPYMAPGLGTPNKAEIAKLAQIGVLGIPMDPIGPLGILGAPIDPIGRQQQTRNCHMAVCLLLFATL